MLTPRTGQNGTRVYASVDHSTVAVHPCVRSPFRGDGRRRPSASGVLWLACLLFASMLSIAPQDVQAQTAAGTEIDNVASAVYRNSVGTPIPVDSNLDRITVIVSRTPSTLIFLKYGAGLPSATPTDINPQTCSQSGDATGPFVPSPGMTDFAGNPIDLTAPVPLVADGAYHAGEPVFLRLEDQDQNLDPAAIEMVDVVLTTDGGDRETLRLSENGPNTGIFYGYIMSALPPPAPGDCRISVAVGESIRADYTDIVDGSDASSDVSLVDPFGVVFDSTTGAPIDGAEVTLWDVLAGAPANPIGDDGLSSFPATIISGGTATDSSGQTYDFDPGRFRFPFVMPGRYELRIVPPATHSHPSVVSTVELQNLPGGPYAIVPGSRGEEFVVPVGPAVQVDIPLDPAGGDLLITKQAGKQRVGGGEFVPYRLRITNGSGATIVAAELVDRLPARFRYEQDSAQITGGTALEPTVSRNGTELVFALGDLAANDTVELQYVARVATGAKPGDHINRAFVQSPSGARSNVAEAVVQVEPDLFDNRAYLMGRIHIDACDLDPDEPAEGLGGVKVYLEDGSFVLTDDEGRYHFEAISAGTHVVQVDLDSIPDAFEMDDCEPTQRRAGRTFSEFVEVRPGTLWRSDFHVRHKVPANGALSQEFSARIEGEGATTRVEYALKLAADRVDATGLTAMIRLPDALEFEAGSAIIEDEKAEASAEAGPLVVRLDRIPAGETRTLRFHATLRADAAPSADEMLESTVIVRARPAEGKAVSTPPAKLRFPIVLAEAVAPPEPVRPAVEPPVPEAVPSAAVLPAPAPVEKVLKHRLLHRPEGATSRYALQIFVDEELPDVILAEVDLPAHQSMVDWSPRNEIGTPVTTIRNGSTTRFILPRHASRRAVRVFLMNGQPQRVLQVFFRAKSNGAGTASATSRVLPSPMSAPAARADRVRKDLGEMPRANTNRDSETARSIRRGSNAQASGKRAAATGGKKQDTTSDRRAKMAKAAGLSAAKRETATTRAGSKVTLRNENSEVDSSGGGEDRAAQAEADLAASAPAPIPVDERFGPAWLASAAPGRSFIYPEEGDLPRIPSLKIGVQHEPSVKVELTRNGEPISPANFDGRIQNTDRTSALSRWRGVGLEEGENELVAIFRNPEGAEVGRTTRTIHLAGAPVRAKLVPEESTLIADGRTPPVVALRLFDRWGMPVREGATGQFDLDPPYQTKQAVDAARTEALAELGFDRPSFVVEEDGIARIQLHPTSVVGDARLRFQFREEREDEIRAWLEPGDREWVLVGLATGTVGWNHANEAASGRDSRRSNDVEEGVITEGRVAFFAKGRVPGDFLLTAAYDTDASNTRLRDRLFQTLEPDEHYTLYGDTTQRDFDAPTSGALYVKIERKRFYALYGDYQTGLEETELSRYSRSLTGAKLEYRGEHFEANAFVTDSDQSFVMDEIPGDGTSGLYRLSRQEIVAGSETVTIETRDRFRPEIVLSEEPQARFTDYDIDYRDGTIFFRRPIAGQDDNFDPIFIVVDYETNDRRDNAVTGGGRLAARALDGRVEVGFTGIHESGDQIESQLFGGDVTLGLGPATELRAEFAHTQGDDFVGDREGNAWLVEVDHRDERVDVRAYAQEQESEFGLGQQRGTNGSLRSYGIDAGFDWTGQLRSETSLFRQENLDTDAKRNVAELRTRWERGAYGMNAGVRYAGDDNEEGSNDAVQVLAGGRTDFFDGAISLRAEGEAALMEDQFGDFPYRALVGGDWRIHERLSFFVDQEFTFGDEQRSADTRAGFRGAPWKGASVTTTVNQENREFGPRTYANLGLQQRFDLSSKWGFDLSLDRTATIRDPGNPSFRVGSGAPAASGSFSDDYTAVSVGTAYREELWSATGRLEARFGENEDRWGLIAGFLRDTNEDLSWSAKVDLFYSDARSGAEELRSDTSLSLAYRPLRSHWIVLDRLDFEYRDNSGGEFDFESRRLLHHFKANQLHGRRTQIAWQLSNKLIVDTINGQNYTNFGTLVGTEMRRDFATGWDMSMHARVRHQTSGDEVSVGYGLSVGRILVDNVWLSLGYNLVGFYDDEFSGADYTAQGPYFRIRAKFDQLSVKEALKLFR